MPSCPSPEPQPFADRLLEWWDQYGRKNLPWQHPRTPYRVWVSEIMLQQTQVSTVIPYFERWMQRFPNIVELAKSPLDDVLAHWAGLGYYARARNLHRSAQICMQQYDGTMPSSSERLSTLPGIGRSTANAIVSQAADQPAAVLDGNVRRVLARHARVDGWPGSAKVQETLWREAESRLPENRGADYTQAIMDLGAMLCSRKAPDCQQCPVNADCKARAAGVIHCYPAAKPRTKVNDRTVFMLILHDLEQGVVLEKRPPAGIWGGLWSLPEAESLAALELKTGLTLADGKLLPPRLHRLTHLRLHIQPVLLHGARSEGVKCAAEQCWMTLDNAAGQGIPKPVAQLLHELKHGEFA
jgi:A/G-specific adenine glycosylase